jgi:hypothetical protein
MGNGSRGLVSLLLLILCVAPALPNGSIIRSSISSNSTAKHRSSQQQRALARMQLQLRSDVSRRRAAATPPPPSRESLNALDFGAKGDCFFSATKPAWQVCSDDAPHLQSAIDAAQLQRRALFIPAGSYGINTSLVIHSNANSSDGYKFGPLRLFGEGKALTTINALKPGMLAVLDLPMVSIPAPGYANPHEDIEVEHIGLHANSHADYCFHAPAIARSKLSNVDAGGARKVAILMAYGWINRVVECTISHNHWPAGAIFVTNSANSIMIQDNVRTWQALVLAYDLYYC